MSHALAWKALSAPDWVHEAHAGRLPLPFHVSPPPACYGYPPALVPLWSTESPSYIGLWWHGPLGRPPVFVRLFVGEGRRVREIARDYGQLALWVVWEGLEANEGPTDEVVRFAEAAGVAPASIEALDAAQVADDPRGLLCDPRMAADPSRSVLDGLRRPQGANAAVIDPPPYRGNMPDELGDGYDSLRNFPFEIASGMKEANDWRLENAGGGPEATFDARLAAGDVAGAWRALHVRGWRFGRAREAATALDQAITDPVLYAVLACWLAQSHERAER